MTSMPYSHTQEPPVSPVVPTVPALDLARYGKLPAALLAVAEVAARADQLAEEESARGPQTFQAVNNLLVDAGIGLDRLAGDDPKLKAANTALQYATEAVEERAARESADRYIARDFPAVAEGQDAEPEAEEGHPAWCVPGECISHVDTDGTRWVEHHATARDFVISDGGPNPVKMSMQLAFTPGYDNEPVVYLGEIGGNAVLLPAARVPAAQAVMHAAADTLGTWHAAMTGGPAGRPGDPALMAALNAIERAVAEAPNPAATRRALQSYAARVGR
ncbi:hypothetical protein ACGFZG_08765 [Streptomyces antibioticus]|uniref:hypothetical protein n=1 Tax=Streptomyces antibioticus TaxID=1890 RepID=UPI00371B967B